MKAVVENEENSISIEFVYSKLPKNIVRLES